MAVSRSYLCEDCDYRWSHLHFDREDPIPECPMCLTRAAAKQVPGTFNIGTVKSKAIDYTQRMVEEDYGMTNMRDNMREGDIAAMAPSPVQTAEAEQLTRAMMEATPELSPEQGDMVNNFWMKGETPPPPAMQAMTQMARANASQQSQDGSDPIAMLHTSEKAATAQTGGRMKLDVVGRSKVTDIA